MPVPVEVNSLRRMSTITVPKQDISFDEYDFQLCVPQNDVKDTLESRDLEASFCRDFECCGLVLNDLHDLLQHYEEYHVRSEDDDGSFFDDSDCSWSSPLSPFSTSSMDESIPSSPISDDEFTNLDALKKRAAAYLSDLYNASSSASVSSTLSTPASPILLNDELNSEENTQASASSATVGASSVSKKTAGKKRSYSQYNGSPSALDLLTQSAAKKLALASSLNGGDIPTPILTDEDFLAQAGALLASTNTNSNADKPYKCSIPGCDKAYKNPNGLKYHNQHGHCNLLNEDNDNNLSKPYQCTIGDCGKRYKNLNGLKYHIEHSHMAALNQTLATFGSSLFTAPPTPAASPIPSSNTSPMLSAAAIVPNLEQSLEPSLLTHLF